MKVSSRAPVLNETNHNAIPVYAQEPRFNELDKEYLASLGITVVENPGIWGIIDSETLAYSPGAEAEHFRKIAKKEPGIWWPVHLDYIKYVQQM